MSSPADGSPETQPDFLRVLRAIREMADALPGGDNPHLGPEMGRGVPKLLEIVAKATESDRSALFLLDVERAELVLAGDYPGAPDLAAQYRRMPAQRTATGAIVQSLVTRVLTAAELRNAPGLAAAGFVECAVVPLQIQGRPTGSLHLVRNTSRPYTALELRTAEILAGQLAVQLESARLYAESQRRIDDLSLINELGSVVSEHLDLPTVLSAGVRQLCRIVDVRGVFLLLLDDAGTHLRTAASVLEGSPGPEVAIGLDERSAATLSFHERAPMIIEDVVHDDRAHPALGKAAGFSSLMAAPLITRGKAIGAVVLGSTDPDRHFTRADIDHTMVVANLLAGAISNARLFEQERQRVRDLSLLSDVARAVAGTLDREILLGECLERVCSALELDRGMAFVPGPGTSELTRIAQRGAGALDEAPAEALCREAIGSGAPAQAWTRPTPDSEPVGACAVPLLAGKDCLGVLHLAGRDRPFQPAELATLGAMGPEIAVGLEKCRLYSEARRRVDELKLLVDVGRAVTASLDLDRILAVSASILTQMIDASNSFILLLDDDLVALRGVATSNPEYREQVRTIFIPYDATSIAARCVRTGTTIVIDDASRSTEVNKALLDFYGEKSLIAIPLMVREKPIGAVVIDDTRAIRTWTRSEIERAEVVAHQVAVAVANARLFDDLKRSYGDLALAQEELVKRERLAALGELAAVMAHEVRNPLGVIFNSLGTLGRLLRPTADAAILLAIVHEEADRLNHLVTDLLDFARPKTPAMQPESLLSVIEGAVEAATSEPTLPGVQVCTEVPSDIPPVEIDARMMRRALVNLVVNGLQAMSRGGTLTVRASTERRGDRSIARVDVIDTGPGILPDVAPHMFQPFFTTKASGTGLGLAVVKSIIEAHRGELSVDSRPGEGTTFTVRLPFVKEAVPPAPGW